MIGKLFGVLCALLYTASLVMFVLYTTFQTNLLYSLMILFFVLASLLLFSSSLLRLIRQRKNKK